MSISYLDEALHYFSKHAYLLGNTEAKDINERILLADDAGRVRFMQAIFSDILDRDLNLSEPIALGGLRAAIDPAATVISHSLFAKDIPDSLRLSTLECIYACFASVFSHHCKSALVHRGGTTITPWNSLCFMWWELLPRHGIPYADHLKEIDHAIINTMESIISLSNLACKESALHGLGLWHIAYPDEVRNLIEKHANLIPESMKEYASKAASGNLQ